MADRTLDELANDPAVERALQRLGRQTPTDPCPRCGQAPIDPTSTHGFCQPCDTWQDERIRASRRRSYHRRKRLPTNSYKPQHTATDQDEGVLVGDTGWRLLTVQEAADVLAVHRTTIHAMIRDGRLRSLKLGDRSRRIPADAIADLVDENTEEGQR